MKICSWITILAAARGEKSSKILQNRATTIVTHVESSNVYPRLPFKIDLRCHQKYRATRAHDRNVCAPQKQLHTQQPENGRAGGAAGGGPVQNNGNMSVRIVQLSVSSAGVCDLEHWGRAGCLLIESVPKIKSLCGGNEVYLNPRLPQSTLPLSSSRTNYRSRSAALAQIRSAREGCICRGALANGFGKEAPLLTLGAPLSALDALAAAPDTPNYPAHGVSPPLPCQNWLQMNAFGNRDNILGRRRAIFSKPFFLWRKQLNNFWLSKKYWFQKIF
jgi:hypothetical protein